MARDFLELDPEPLARRNVLGDDHRLGEEVVRQLDVEGQIEADGAATHIGAPARDIRIVLEDGIEAAGHGLAGKDRGILRQAEVDEQLGPVGRRERTAAE